MTFVAKKIIVKTLLVFRMVRRNQVVDLYPFDKDEYKKGIEQAIMEVMETRRILQESIDDLIHKVPNPSDNTMEKLEKLKCRLTKIELILCGLRSLL